MIKNINININRDDPTLNDYLFCLSEFDETPSKITIFNNYKTSEFLDFTNDKSVIQSVNSEIIPDEENIINEKKFVKIEDFFVSFVIYDKLSKFSHITDMSIYYKQSSEIGVNVFVESISKFAIGGESLDSDDKFNIITVATEGLQLDPIIPLQSDYDNMELYYNDNIIKRTKKIIKLINKNNKGLSVIYGERGVGKTSLVNYIISNLDKKSIFIPSHMIDSINTNDFRNLIKKNPESIIIIDDCEIFFSNSYSKSNLLTNNILQIIDGITSDMDNIHIMTILNTGNISDIDPILLECNNLIDQLEVSYLSDSKVDKLCEHLKQKNKSKSNKLIDILKKRKNDDEPIKIGFY